MITLKVIRGSIIGWKNGCLNPYNDAKIALVINTGGGSSETQLSDAVSLRRATLANKVPYCTNMSTAKVCLEGIKSLKLRDISVNSLQDV